MATYQATFKTADAFMEAMQKADAKPDVPMAAGLNYYNGKTANGLDTKFTVDTRGANPVYKQTCKM